MTVTEETASAMRRMREAGYLLGDIGAEFGVSRNTVLAYTGGAKVPTSLSVHGYRHPTTRRGRPRVNDERNAAWAARVEAGDTLQSIADEVGLTRECVRQAVALHQLRTGERVLRPVAGKPLPFRPKASLAQIVLRRAKREGECWVWKGCTSGYRGAPLLHPQARKRYGLPVTAHRAAFTLWRDSRLSSEQIVPTCGNHRCINPFHWEKRAA